MPQWAYALGGPGHASRTQWPAKHHVTHDDPGENRGRESDGTGIIMMTAGPGASDRDRSESDAARRVPLTARCQPECHGAPISKHTFNYS